MCKMCKPPLRDPLKFSVIVAHVTKFILNSLAVLEYGNQCFIAHFIFVAGLLASAPR